ncbi:ATP-binding protein, partial [Streptomyces sp. M2CJ-2]|nr:ATP-binding protein [Streptomyces sp. M2CJ-2]
MTVHLIKAPHNDTEAPSSHRERRRARFRTVARAALQDERIRAAGRLTVRHGAYVTGGARIVARRAWDGRTASRYERMIR